MSTAAAAMKAIGLLSVSLVATACHRPKEEFFTCVRTLQRNLATNYLIGNITGDVKKTDSILTPLVGTIFYTVADRKPADSDNWIANTYYYNLIYATNRWTLVSVQTHLTFSWAPNRNYQWRDEPIPRHSRVLGIIQGSSDSPQKDFSILKRDLIDVADSCDLTPESGLSNPLKFTELAAQLHRDCSLQPRGQPPTECDNLLNAAISGCDMLIEVNSKYSYSTSAYKEIKSFRAMLIAEAKAAIVSLKTEESGSK